MADEPILFRDCIESDFLRWVRVLSGDAGLIRILLMSAAGIMGFWIRRAILSDKVMGDLTKSGVCRRDASLELRINVGSVSDDHIGVSNVNEGLRSMGVPENCELKS
jgi:hypothetical protein